MPTSKRERLIHGIDRVGLNRLLECVACRPALVALAYHRIGTCVDQPFDDELFSATADDFRRQVLNLRKHFDLLSVDDLLHATRDGRLALKRPAALITFDDGYRDNCEVAFPILRELGAPAVFFVAAGYIDEPALTWWDRVAYVVKHTRRTIVELDYPANVAFDLNEICRNGVIQRILRLYKRTPEIDQARFFERLEAKAEVPVDSAALCRRLFMSWDQVREMKRGGMEIGAHTYSHPVLSRNSEEVQRRELSQSKDRLEAETGAAIRIMSYPVGGQDAFTETTKRLARELGYRAAFSYYGGVNRPGHSDLFDLRRMTVDRGDSFPMFRFRTRMNNLCGKSLL